MKQKYGWYLLILVIVVLIGGGFYLDDQEIKNDYYEAINEEILSQNLIKEGEFTWSTFSEAQEQSDEKVQQIVRNVVELKNEQLDVEVQKKMKIVYENAMDWEERNRVGISPLMGYLDGVMNSWNLSEFVEQVIFIENELGVDIFTRLVVEQDYMDHQNNMVYLYPMTFSFGTSADYWVDSDYMGYQAYIKRAMIQLLKVYGYNQKEARDKVHRLVHFYEDVGEHSKLEESFYDVKEYYHRVTKQELGEVYSNLNISEYLVKRGIGEEEYYSLVDEGQYRWLNQYLTEENLELWKDFVLLKVLECYASYASQDYQQVVNDLNLSLMGLEEERTTDEERAIDLVANLFSNEVDLIYQEEVLSLESRDYVAAMVEDIRDCYQKMLEYNGWLSSETKERATIKLEKMKIQIGEEEAYFYGDWYQIDSFCDGGSLIDNVIRVWKVNRSYELNRLKNESKNQGFDQRVVNAYYNPLENTIYIPAAVMFLFDIDADYYENLGSIGMIVAHEMTHGFDGNGSQFDQDGNLANWWTEEDKIKFETLKEQVRSYYSKYEVIRGKYIDGERTVNENIADLGAVSCIVNIAKEKGADKQELQMMFSSFAKMWVSQSREEYMELLLLRDSHAPSKYRVNAVLSSIDEFYLVYDVHFWNDMYLSSGERVQVW